MTEENKIKFTKKAIVALAFLAVSALAASAGSFEGRVVRVLDGDTIDVLVPEKTIVRVRLAGIDAPERGQPFGRKATQAVRDMAAGKTVRIASQSKDRYGRTIGEAFLPDGRSLNRELVRLGLAWQYRQYSDDQELANLEAEARKATRGLWSDQNSVPPWEWRRGRRNSTRILPRAIIHRLTFSSLRTIWNDFSGSRKRTMILRGCCISYITQQRPLFNIELTTDGT